MAARGLLTIVLAVTAVAGVATPTGARGAAGQGGGDPIRSQIQESSPVQPEAATPFQLVTERLRLDRKTQVPAAQDVFTAAAAEAAPVGQQMLQIRQRLVNLAMADRPDETKAALAESAVAAEKMVLVESRAFAKIFALLKPNQQASAPQAFGLMAGIFQPTAPASRGGGRGAGGGRGGIQLTRLEILEAAFTFEKDQKKTVKAILDEAHKSAAAARDGLAKTRQALGAAVQAARPQPEVDQAAQDYAGAVAQMTSVETAALAKLLQLLDKNLENPAGIQAAFFLTRGMFLGTRGWDNIPDGKLY